MYIKIALVYFAIISVVAFVITVWDKYCAKRDMWRVPENTLMLVSLLGGSVAMYITMKTVRHKTKHAKFMFGIPLIMVLQAALIAALWWLGNN